MKNYWFDKEDRDTDETFLVEQGVAPYKERTTISDMRQMEFSKEHQAELNNKAYTLHELTGLLSSMLIDCNRSKSKSLTLTERDFQFLLAIARQKITIDWRGHEKN